VYVAVIVAAVYVHPLLFAGVFSLIVGQMIRELYLLLKFDAPLWLRRLGIAGGMYLFAASCLYAGSYAGYEIYLPYIIILSVLLISELYIRPSDPVGRWGAMLFAQCYCAGTISLLSFIPYMTSPVYDPLPVLMIFVFIWLNDTGAFLIGSRLGKRRLFPRISPRKSWEGFWGGILTVAAASFLCAYFFRGTAWWQWLIFALITAVAATWGDLIESLLKRTCGVKDSGKILPGHGGMLDRFDSAIFASPFVYVFFEIIGIIQS
jgi:phosphatidate cytidylyltransferase